MFDLVAVSTGIAARLATIAGLAVTRDPRDVNAPCALVGLPRVTGLTNACVADVEIDVHLIAPPPGNLDAVDWLLGMVPFVLDVLAAREAEPEPFQTSPTTSLPSYRVSITTSATESE